MDKLISKTRSLKTSFVWMVFITVLLVTVLSLITIFSCLAMRSSLVLDDDEILLTSRTININGEVVEEKIHMRANGEPNSQLIPEGVEQYTEYVVEPIHSPLQLSPKRRMLYNALPVFMVALPSVFALTGIVICSLFFYRRKLREPLAVLTDCSEKISNNDLDFTVSYTSADEMGLLCASFEKMRAALLESQQMIWNMVEERRQLNASVAHDLRTPITIIEGYTEYLQRNIPKGKIDDKKLMDTLSNLSEAASRLEHYVNSVRDIQSLDEIEIKKDAVPAYATVKEMTSDLAILAAASNKEFDVSFDLEDTIIYLDRSVLYRILENTMSNALRYADKKIKMSFTLKDSFLDIQIVDDGTGFSSEALATAFTPFYKETDKQGHMGLGLTICKILSKKHGGQVIVYNNNDGGAVVHITMSVK